MSISEKIKFYRKEKGITQQQLANKIDKTLSSVKKYESGYTTPPIKVIKEIAKALNISLDCLIENEKDSDDNIVTLSLHNANGIDDELPEEAQKEIESFIEYIKQKYKK